MKLGQFKELDPEENQRLEEEKRRKIQEEEEHVASMKVGDRFVDMIAVSKITVNCFVWAVYVFLH